MIEDRINPLVSHRDVEARRKEKGLTKIFSLRLGASARKRDEISYEAGYLKQRETRLYI
jgi:hypothetical protein